MVPDMVPDMVPGMVPGRDYECRLPDFAGLLVFRRPTDCLPFRLIPRPGE